MFITTTSLNRMALLKADEIREQYSYDEFQPLSPIDLAIKMGVQVRIISANSMEGMYLINEQRTNPTIILSNQRPFPRRLYTCGHELGHHIFNHGTKIDQLQTDTQPTVSRNEDEILVDCFAGALLMPVLGVEAELATRGWKQANVSALQFYTIASHFGVGYKTLITHCSANKIITAQKAQELSKVTPAKILQSLFGMVTPPKFFKVIDCNSELPNIDLEVGNYLFFPSNAQAEGDHLEHLVDSIGWTCYRAVVPGIVRITVPQNGFSSFVRIQNAQYEGLAENRHLEHQ